MTTKIYVTDAQVEAARMIVERNARRGLPISRTVREIAEAMPESAVPGDTDTAPDSTTS